MFNDRLHYKYIYKVHSPCVQCDYITLWHHHFKNVPFSSSLFWFPPCFAEWLLQLDLKTGIKTQMCRLVRKYTNMSVCRHYAEKWFFIMQQCFTAERRRHRQRDRLPVNIWRAMKKSIYVVTARQNRLCGIIFNFRRQYCDCISSYIEQLCVLV